MILCIGPTPAAQRVMLFNRVTPNEVNRAVSTHDGASGKAVNVAKVLQTLGEKALVLGFLGGLRGEEVRAGLLARGLPMDFLDVTAVTRQCITVVDQASHTVTELVQESLPVEPAAYEKLLRLVHQHLARGCLTMILSGTIPPGGPADFYYQCAKMARDHGGWPAVDAKGALLVEALKARPALVKPNRSELAATVGRDLPDEAAVITAARQLVERGAERVVVTDGARPILAFDGASTWRIVPPRVEALNPIGSGDAFTAALVVSLRRGDDLGRACCAATAAGAANALSVMPGELELADFQRLARQIEPVRLATS